MYLFPLSGCDCIARLRKLTLKSKVQFFVEPFHRMFSLDNLAIQYPHAIVERVPVCKSARLLYPLSIKDILAESDILSVQINSLAIWLRWWNALISTGTMGYSLEARWT